MKNETCNGRSPWKCSAREADAIFKLRARGVDIVQLENPLAVLRAIEKAEWDALMADDAGEVDDVQSSVRK